MTLHTGRHFLQIPGPTNVPDRVLRAMDMPTLDHRGPEFAELGYAVLAGCQRIFRTKQPVIIYPSSGTGAWEAAIVNTFPGALTTDDDVARMDRRIGAKDFGAAKQRLRAQLNLQMGQPNFWDNQEKAQQTIQQLKPLNGLLKPFEDQTGIKVSYESTRDEDAILTSRVAAGNPPDLAAAPSPPRTDRRRAGSGACAARPCP